MSQDRHDGKRICRRDDATNADALASRNSIIPLCGDGLALEDVPHEYEETPDCDDYEACPEYVSEDGLYGKTEEEDAYAELYE
jgi:hypothetical protein